MRIKLRVSGGRGVGKTRLIQAITKFLHEEYIILNEKEIKASVDKGIPVERKTITLQVK